MCKDQALPPFAQTSREIQAILQSPETHRLIGSAEAILEIIRQENGYLVISTHHELFVEVQYPHTGKIGPADFELVFRS